MDDLTHASVEDLENIGILRGDAIAITQALNRTQNVSTKSGAEYDETNLPDGYKVYAHTNELPVDDNYIEQEPPLSQVVYRTNNDRDGNYSRYRETTNIAPDIKRGDYTHLQNNVHRDDFGPREQSVPQPFHNDDGSHDQSQKNGGKNYFPFPRRPSVSQLREAHNGDRNLTTDDYNPPRHTSMSRNEYARSVRPPMSQAGNPPINYNSDPRHSSVSPSRRAPDDDSYRRSVNDVDDYVHNELEHGASRNDNEYQQQYDSKHSAYYTGETDGGY